MSVSLHCPSCEISVWSSAFHLEGDHRCPDCTGLLGPRPDEPRLEVPVIGTAERDC